MKKKKKLQRHSETQTGIKDTWDILLNNEVE